MAPASTPRTARALVALAVAAALAGGCASHTESGGARLGQAESWSSVAGGPANQGRAHGEVSDSPELVWSRALGAPAIGVASSDGIGTSFQATISERGCNLFALTAEDGRKRWCSRLPTDGPRITATVDGRGSLFVPTYGGVGAVAAEGENRWSAVIPGVPTTVTLLDGRHLLLVSHLGAARVVNAHTGLDVTPEVRLAGDVRTGDDAAGIPWCATGRQGCPVPAPAAVDTGTGTAYVTAWTPGEDDPELVAVRLVADGFTALDELWRVPLPGGRLGTPPVLSDDGSEVYVHAGDGSLGAYSTSDGSARWSADIGYRPDMPPALLPGGALVTGGRTTTVWRGPDDDHDDDAGPAPVVAVRGQDGTGEEIWRRDDLQQLTNPVTTPDGRVLVAVRSDGSGDATGGRDGDGPGIAVHLLDGGDGTTLHRIAVPSATGPVAGLSVDSDGRIALSTAMGAVYVFE